MRYNAYRNRRRLNYEKSLYANFYTLFEPKVIGAYSCGNLKVLEKPVTEYIDITWGNFGEMYMDYNMSIVLCLRECRKGFKFWSWTNSIIKPIRQWKVPELNMQLEIEYKEMKPTIQELLRYITIDELNDLINQ